MIEREDHGTVAVLRMRHGKVNAIDLEMLEALHSAFESLQPESTRAVVFTGNDAAFSAGVDLFRVLKEGQPYLLRFLPAFDSFLRQLFSFPKPVIAAVNGHAIAGGCVFTCACDYRLMSGGTIGLPELLVGVPFPALALEVVRMPIGPQYFQEVVYTGRTYSPEEALRRGIVDEVVDQSALLDRAIEVAQQMAAIPQDSFRIVKRQIRMPVLARLESTAPLEETIRVWSDPRVHSVVKAYLDRTIGKNRK